MLLANGASLVFAIDVGRGQLHPSLHGHPKDRLAWKRPTSANSRASACRRGRMSSSIDVSFISLKAVLPVALALAAAPMHLLALIKPQYEADRKQTKHGIIRNAMVHQADLRRHRRIRGLAGLHATSQVFPSSITGGDGNIEFFLGARRG